jgi:hypothetical protein
MRKTSSMNRLGLILAVLVALPHAAAAQGTAAAPQVRMRWQDFSAGADGAKRVASFQKAVQKMKSLDGADPTSADFRRSWAYWANIHGYYGSQSPDGTVAQQIAYLKSINYDRYIPYYDGIVDQTPPDQIAQTTWATCQHSGQTQALNFFGWHRMYLYYFEQVLRWAAQDDSLRLPYWDYTDPSQLALPKPYQATAAAFYDSKRNPSINTGAATLSGVRTNVNRLLDNSDYFDYEQRIEEGIHGYVHCTVGPTCPVAHMGDVPVAGNDPVFYSHHANIDRLWACWQNLYPLPAGDWQSQQFSFPDATGTLQTRPVKEFFDSTLLGYVYDNTTGCKRPAAARQAAGPGKGGAKKPMLAAKKGVAVAKPLVQVEMGLPMAEVKSAVAALAADERIDLVLRDVTADSPPGVLFDVWLVRKGGKRELAGTISFFGLFGHRHSGGEAGGHGAHDKKGGAMQPRSFEFDVTDLVRQLGDGDLMVEIEATDGREMVDPKQAAEARKKAAADFRSAANLKIGSIELVVTGGDDGPGT